MKSNKIVPAFLMLLSLIAPACDAQDPSSYQVSSPSAETSVVSAPGQWFDGWYQGAAGYAQAVEEYKQTNKPMVVYMTVGWCPYCRKFEKEILLSPRVQDMLKDKIKVTINPESGSRENAIAFQYGIRGFPSFFLHPPQPGGAVQLYTGVSPQRFVEFFDQILK